MSCDAHRAYRIAKRRIRAHNQHVTALQKLADASRRSVRVGAEAMLASVTMTPRQPMYFASGWSLLKDGAVAFCTSQWQHVTLTLNGQFIHTHVPLPRKSVLKNVPHTVDVDTLYTALLNHAVAAARKRDEM